MFWVPLENYALPWKKSLRTPMMRLIDSANAFSLDDIRFRDLKHNQPLSENYSEQKNETKCKLNFGEKKYE